MEKFEELEKSIRKSFRNLEQRKVNKEDRDFGFDFFFWNILGACLPSIAIYWYLSGIRKENRRKIQEKYQRELEAKKIDDNNSHQVQHNKDDQRRFRRNRSHLNDKDQLKLQ